MENYDSTGIILRAKKAWGIDSDFQFARILGINKATLSNWKKRNTIDYGLLFSKCKHINPSYLLYEDGEMFVASGIDNDSFRAPLIRISILVVENQDTIAEFEKKANIIGGELLFVNALLHSDEDIVRGWVDSARLVYANSSINWILYGTPPMLQERKGAVQSFDLQTDQKKELRKVPVYEIEASAGFLAVYQDHTADISDYITIPNLPPVDGAIYARGDSMSPLIASGDIVIFKKVELHPDNIIWGSIYIISYTLDGDDFTVLKYIRHSSRDGYIRLESYNPRFDPQDIPSSSITAMALVKASITFHTIG